MPKKLTQKRLKELFHYDPETGVFINKITRGPRAQEGCVSGHVDHIGYLQVGVDYVLYKAHRLAWLYYYGYFPENEIDHVDRIKHHNSIVNLREVSRQCNLRNTANISSNTSGVKGVSWDKGSGKWAVYMRVDLKKRHLGFYPYFNDAVCARLAAEQCLNWSGCNSSSPAYKYVQKMLSD